MAYVRPTPSEFKARYPAFADVPDATIQAYLDDAPVDDSWLESDYSKAIMLWAAHTMTVNGIGVTEIEGYAASGLSRLKSGTLDVSFKDSASSADGQWSGSKYGPQFYVLLRANKGGPRVVIGGYGYCGGYPSPTPTPDHGPVGLGAFDFSTPDNSALIGFL